MALWLTTDDADTYFMTRMGAAVLWTDSLDKTAALTTAQNMITACKRFTFSDDDITTPTDLMKDAVCEQTLFMLRDPDIESRLSLQAQGVSKAGIVSEEYWKASGLIPIASMAEALLSSLASGVDNTFPWSR